MERRGFEGVFISGAAACRGHSSFDQIGISLPVQCETRFEGYRSVAGSRSDGIEGTVEASGHDVAASGALVARGAREFADYGDCPFRIL